MLRALFLDIVMARIKEQPGVQSCSNQERGETWGDMCDAGRNPTGDAEVTACFALCRLPCALFLGIVLAQIKEQPCFFSGLGLWLLGFRSRDLSALYGTCVFPSVKCNVVANKPCCDTK